MKRTVTSTMTGIALAAMAVGGLSVAPALAAEKDAKPMSREAAAGKSQCVADLGKLRDDLAQDDRFRSAYSAGRIVANDYRDLVDAARVFARNGMEERCRTVVAGIKELAVKSSKDDASMKKPADTEAEKKRRMEAQKAWQARFDAATPVADTEISTETLTGVDVRNAKGEDLGDVADIVVAGGAVKAVVLSHGGFLGIGSSYYKLTAQQARIATMDENDAGDIVVVVDMTEQQVEALPEVAKENGRWVAASDTDQTAEDKDATTKKKDADTVDGMNETDKKAQ